MGTSSMGANEAQADAETVAKTLALADVEHMGATIRPRDYEHSDTLASGDRTFDGSLPVVTLSEPLFGDQAPGASEAPLEIIGTLGEGGMGRVLLARQRSLGREVAVKVLKTTPSGAAARALVHEGRLLGSVEHPNVLPIHALGSDREGRPALVMKRIDGVAWRDLILSADHPFWSEVQTIAKDRLSAHLEILMQISQAVHFAHQRGILHRDIKSENVIVGRFGEISLADWGIAVQKDALASELGGRVVGTPSHLAPEMARGDLASIDERTDVYLLGSTLHEILTGGQGRHKGKNLFSLVCAAIESAPVEHDASVPSELAAIENRATARDPADRFSSALAFREAIADYLSHAGSVQLAQATAERQAELLALLRTSTPEKPAALDAVYRLLSECRFGFSQAMREWPENVEAQRQLEDSLVEVARFELECGRLAATRALLSELPSPPAELSARLHAQEAREQDERARTHQLEKLERDVDLTLSATQYAWFFGGVGVLIAALMIILLVFRAQGYRLGPVGLTVMAGATLAVLLSVVFIKRKTLLDRRASRGVVGLLVAGFTGVFCGRAVGVLDGSVPGQMNNANSVMLGACCVAAAFSLRPWFAWLAPLFLAAAIGGSYSPTNAGLFFLTACVLGTIAGATLWRRDQRRERAGKPADAP